MTQENEKALFGTRFEKLGQERRIQVLSAYGLIDDQARGRFDTIRETRRGYLHLWSQDHESLPNDAVKSYYAAVALVATTTGQEFRDGKIVIHERLVKYLERKGVDRPRERSERQGLLAESVQDAGRIVQRWNSSLSAASPTFR
jgi:hypothetical protein